MVSKGEGEAAPRYIPPGSCTACGHKPHDDACRQKIRVGKNLSVSCPCTRRTIQENQP